MDVERHSKRPNLGKLNETCGRKDCPNKSKWQVAFILKPKGLPGSLRVELGLAICEEHGKTAKVDDFLTDESWNMLAEALRRAGKAEPDKAATKLELMPILFGTA